MVKAKKNEEIKSQFVKVINLDGTIIKITNPDGTQKYEVPVSYALKLAKECGTDLVEVSPNASPPICKLIDYSKYIYEQKKKEKVAKKKQKKIEVKEIKMRGRIAQNDYNTKVKNAIRFLSDEDHVKLMIELRGREMMYKDNAIQLANKFILDLEEYGKAFAEPKFEGNKIFILLTPKK